MKENTFLQKNRKQWEQLEAYNTRLAHTRLSRFNADEIREFAHLYRITGYHLAYAKTRFSGSRIVLYLNQIMGIAHHSFFVREPIGWRAAGRYTRHAFPQKVRDCSVYLLAAVLLFASGFAFGAIAVACDRDLFLRIFPFPLGEEIGTADSWNDPIMSAVIMTNNIRVALSAMALGLLAGIGTAYVLIYNGIILGSLTVYVMTGGSDLLTYLSLLLPHGFIELAAIFISGAAGLVMGRALLMPGQYTRRVALIQAAKDMAALLPGIAGMLVLAGLFEGFFTPLDVAAAFKIAFSLITLALMICYFAWSGKPVARD